MPIRPEMRDKYPPKKEWREIRRKILDRAQNRCEQCGAPNHTPVLRGWWVASFSEEDWRPVYWDGARVCMADDGELYEEHTGATAPADEYRWRLPLVRIILTISHTDHDPTHNDPSNLRALCQRCHLRYDRHHHAQTAVSTRTRKRGGPPLPLEQLERGKQ